MEEEKKVSIPLVVGGVALIIVVGAGGIFISLNQNQPATSSTGQQLESFSNQTDPLIDVSDSSTYKDGTYESTGSYTSPAGDETIGVNVTIAGNIITDVKVTPEATDSESQLYEGRFARGVSSLVVGKRLGSFSVRRVNGSSLTGTGFNAALARIKNQARV